MWCEAVASRNCKLLEKDWCMKIATKKSFKNARRSMEFIVIKTNFFCRIINDAFLSLALMCTPKLVCVCIIPFINTIHYLLIYKIINHITHTGSN